MQASCGGAIEPVAVQRSHGQPSLGSSEHKAFLLALFLASERLAGWSVLDRRSQRKNRRYAMYNASREHPKI